MTSFSRPSLLPPLESPEAYEAIWSDDSQFQAAAQQIVARHGIHEPMERYRSGTAVAYRVGEAVLKLYPSFYARDAALEREVLRRAGDDPALPTPRVLAQGTQEGWSYLLMTRLVGTPIEDFADRPSVLYRLVEELGATLKRLHALPASSLPRADAAGDPFRALCRSRAVAHHIARGFSAARARELEAFLVRVDADASDEGPHVLLHTELGLGHVLADGARVSGIFDFGEAREGPRSFDFAAVGLFVSRGDKQAFRHFLDGYGVPEGERGDFLIRRVMRHALLHPYGHLTFYFQQSLPPNPHDLASAAAHWFGH
jgi:hygromycin-B 7''-O-kinase